MARVAGIDYSMTSPAIVVHDGDEWDLANCKLHFLVHEPKKTKRSKPLPEITNPQFVRDFYPKWDIMEERYHKLAEWTLNIVKDCDFVVVEGYAFGAVGRVFNLAENCGIMKYLLWKHGVSFIFEPPGVFKKYATGKGNATKEIMQESFIRDTNVNVKCEIGQSEKDWNPSSDIIDAYYMAKWGHYELQRRNSGAILSGSAVIG